MQGKAPLPVIPYHGPADDPPPPRRQRRVSLWTIALIIVLCIVAAVIWTRLDREEREKAEAQAQIDQDTAHFRQVEFRVAHSTEKIREQERKEKADSASRDQ